MGNRPRPPAPICGKCGQPHTRDGSPNGTPTCAKHHTDGSGTPCRSWRVPGLDCCTTHGGSAPQTKAAGQRRVAEQRAAAAAALHAPELQIDADEALLQALGRAAGRVEWLRAQRERLADDAAAGVVDATSAVGALWRLEGVEDDRLRRVAKDTLDADVAERQTRIAERTGMLVAELLRAVLDHLQVTGQQRADVLEFARGRFEQLTA